MVSPALTIPLEKNSRSLDVRQIDGVDYIFHKPVFNKRLSIFFSYTGLSDEPIEDLVKRLNDTESQNLKIEDDLAESVIEDKSESKDLISDVIVEIPSTTTTDSVIENTVSNISNESLSSIDENNTIIETVVINDADSVKVLDESNQIVQDATSTNHSNVDSVGNESLEPVADEEKFKFT
jgi:hypothetical protein